MHKNKKIKVLLYLASNSPFYTNLYPSIKRGFEEAGCEVRGASNLLGSIELIEEINLFEPDFVFEMNRVKSEIENFPKGLIHICWLVDFWGRRHEELKGSDILYTWARKWVSEFHNIGFSEVYHLPPATDTRIYKPLDKVKEFDFIFLGHIPNRWTSVELSREIGSYKGESLYFKDILPILQEQVLSKSSNTNPLEILKNKNMILDTPTPKSLIYDISSRVYRQTRREHYLDIFTNISENISIYGSENWSSYTKYSKFYKRYISKPEDINNLLAISKVLLHDGNYPHFRTFDAMASGVVVAAAEPPYEFSNSWTELGFIDGEDYLNVDIYTKNIDLSRFKNKILLEKIAQNARAKILKEHLWVHRAKKVLLDLSSLIKRSSYEGD